MADTHTPYDDDDYLSYSDNGHAETLAVQWIRWLEDIQHRSLNTRKQYIQVLSFWLQWCGQHEVEPLKPELTDLETFMTRKRANGRKGSASSQRTDAAVLRGWYSWMHQRNMVPSNYALDLRGPKAKRRDGRPIEDEHWQAIWQHDLPPRLRTILGLGFYAGLRLEEIGQLRTEQLTSTRVVNYVRKGGGEDTTPWHDMARVHHLKLPHLLPDISVLEHAVSVTRRNHDKIIPWQHGKELWRRMQKLTKQLDIPPYTPHQLRHSAATNLLRAGIAPHIVMRLMNHTSMDTTMGYVRAGARDLREWLELQ